MEFCSEKKEGGLNVGNLKVGSVLFVDDTTVIDGDVVNARKSHEQILKFAEKKRLTFSHDKCFSIVVNKKKNDELPDLEIDGSPMTNKENVKLLDDVINKKGDSHDLVIDRIKRGLVCLISSLSHCVTKLH